MSVAQLLLAVCLWTCFAAVFYAYIGYPVVIWCLSRLFGRRHTPPEVLDLDLPTLSFLVAAYNEESVIEERLRNALALDYPADKLQIVVACDGCNDATAAIVARYADRGVRLLNYVQRRGKSAALNAGFKELNGEIVLLSDANTNTDRLAARKLVRWFQNPDVGAVCGRLILTDPESGRNSESLYWRYETFLKRCEGRLGALLGANGAIYAIRQHLFQPIPPDTIVDDMVIPLEAKLRSGCAILYDCEAVAHEETAKDVRAEFHRRSRIGAGAFQCLARMGALLDPRNGWVAFTFLSHKALRWLCPFFLLALLISNVLLALDGVYQCLLLGQIAFYALALVGEWIPGRTRAVKVLRLATLFTGMNAALLLGFWRWLRGSQKVTWKRTVRMAEMPQTVAASEPPAGIRPAEVLAMATLSGNLSVEPNGQLVS
jgi:cellulose synthase/poly-beta-1,6-N-acetylglucosamine synthase-like glycosyltransferase